jgi:hypothetical protein
MKGQYFSAKELAGLIGMPGTVQNVTAKATRENWPFRNRKGKGGGKEYPEICLPALTQRALTAKRKIQAAKQGHIEASKELPKTFFIMIENDVFEVRKV